MLLGMRRRTLLKTSTIALGSIVGAGATSDLALAHTSPPAVYVVSTEPGVLPEGIELTDTGVMYVTSVGTGAVYRGHVTRPRMAPFLPAGRDGRTKATGIHLDRRGRLFIAGYDTATLFVYTPTGKLLAKRTATAGAALNDFAFTDDAVYVTDSVNQTIWRASLDGWRIGELRPWLTADELQPTPGFLNGIVSASGGRLLLVGDQAVDATYRIDVAARRAVQVQIDDGALFSGDGFLLVGQSLFGVMNRLNASGELEFLTRQVALRDDYRAARVVADSHPVPAAETPTTIARHGRRLLWVNSQIFASPGTPPYTVSEVPGLRL
jgi:hypothetical protein